MAFRPDNLLPELDLHVICRFDFRSIRRHLIENSKLDKCFLMASTATFEIPQSRIDS